MDILDYLGFELGKKKKLCIKIELNQNIIKYKFPKAKQHLLFLRECP
jgi:hypothetical protein